MRETINTKESAAENEANRQILVCGEIGSGKTSLFATLPGKKFMYMFDPNGRAALEALEADVEVAEFIPEQTDLDISVKTLKKDVFDRSSLDKKKGKKLEPKTFIEWEADFQERMSDGFFNQFAWIGLDSHTTLSEMVMDRVQYLNGRLGKHPEQADYTAEMSTMRNIYRSLGSLTGTYVTAHMEMTKDPVTSKIGGQIMMTGKNRIRVPLRFSDILGLAFDKDEKGEPIWILKSVPDKQHPIVRTPLFSLKPIEDVTLDLKKPLEEQGLGQWF